MKIAVVGTGAMGSIYAAYFARAGHEVWAIDLWDAHVRAMAEQGLSIEGPDGGQFNAQVQAAFSVADAEACDLYVVATKVNGVVAASQTIGRAKPEGAPVLLIQNGLGAAERAGTYIAKADMLLGVAEGFGASMIGPGHAKHNAMKRIRLGEPQGGMSDRVREIESLWRTAGFNVEAYEDIDRLIWEKFICNVTFSAPCTVFDRTIGELMDDPASWSVALGCMREAYAVGVARRITFSFDDPKAYVTAFGAQMPKARPSMLLDHHAKRASEIDAINGIVPELGATHDVATPFNNVLSDAVRAREVSFREKHMTTRKQAEGKLAQVTGKDVSINPADHYNAWAETYEHDLLGQYGYRAHRIAARAFADLITDRSAAIIDVGCGTGLVGLELQKFGFAHIDGVDISEKMLDQAQATGIYHKLILEDAEETSSVPRVSYAGAICVGSFGVGHLGPQAVGQLISMAKPEAPIVIFMNAEPYIDEDYEMHLRSLEHDGVWKILRIEDHNYMDALERPGKLIVALRSEARA